MEIKEQPLLSFFGVDILHTSFSVDLPPIEGKQAIDIEIIPKVYYPAPDRLEFKIIMDVKIVSKNFFDLALIAAGSFKINQEIDSATRQQLVDGNSTAIMFPYVRSFISVFTSNCGNSIKPIILPSRFFKGQLEEVVLPEKPV